MRLQEGLKQVKSLYDDVSRSFCMFPVSHSNLFSSIIFWKGNNSVLIVSGCTLVGVSSLFELSDELERA